MQRRRGFAPVALVALWVIHDAVSAVTVVAGNDLATTPFPPSECPPKCERLFGNLEAGPDGNTQNVELQIRGEPKSGTGMMAEWAWGALAHACLYLQKMYGESSCRVEWESTKDDPDIDGNPHSIIFEPALAAEDAEEPLCTCNNVKRVEIKMSAIRKHKLPVDSDCDWYHGRGISIPGNTACTRSDGERVTNQRDLIRCFQDAMCEINDNRLQMAVLRDPRAITVSSYFQLLRQRSPRTETQPWFESVDEFFVAHLASVSMWVSIRYHLFTQVLQHRSVVFWYEEALADPVDWHGRYYTFVGINLPNHAVDQAAAIATRGGSILGFPSKGLDGHPGGEEQSVARTFRDELQPESLTFMDDVLRVWLPPVVLDRLGLLE